MSATTAEWMIELLAVSKSYGAKEAVKNLTLRIAAGELFAFLGPNGAGKTTTIKMMTGLLRPSSGTVRIAGVDMATNSAEARRAISYVPDQPFLYEKLTGREFFAFIRDLYGLDAGEFAPYEEELIRTFELEEFVDHLAETYSHGMRQRLAFAAALLHRPKILVVDEPMVGLDPKSMRIVKDLLINCARKGMTVFMSTHTLAIAEEVADRIGIIQKGQLIRCGTMAELEVRAGDNGQSLEDYFLNVTAEASV